LLVRQSQLTPSRFLHNQRYGTHKTAKSCIFTAGENVFLNHLRGLSLHFFQQIPLTYMTGPLFSAISAHILRVLCGLRF
jgi:hypothetical protein